MSRFLAIGVAATASAVLSVASCVSDEPELVSVGSQTDAASGSDGPNSNNDGSSPSDGAAPGPAPKGVTACAGNQQATVYFPALAGAASYNLYYRNADEAAPGHQISGVTSPVKTPAQLLNGQQAFVSISAVVGGVESNRSQEVSISPYAFTPPHDVIFAAGDVSLVAFDSYSTLADGALPSRTVTGAATTISSPLYGSLAVNAPLGLLYLASSGSNSVAIWRDPAAITNNAAPDRALTAAGKLISPGAVAVDRTRNRLYVANSQNGPVNPIFVWDDACNVTGETAPTATLAADATTNLSRPGQLFVDETNDKLFVADDSSYKIFNGASAWSGAVSVAPSVALVPMVDAGGSSGAFGITLDSAHDTLYLANRDYGATKGAVLAVTASTVASGTLIPMRAYVSDTSSATGFLTSVMNIQIDGSDRLFALRDTGSQPRIERWDSMSLLNGTATAPNRYVLIASGSATSFVYLP